MAAVGHLLLKKNVAWLYLAMVFFESLPWKQHLDSGVRMNAELLTCMMVMAQPPRNEILKPLFQHRIKATSSF